MYYRPYPRRIIIYLCVKNQKLEIKFSGLGPLCWLDIISLGFFGPRVSYVMVPVYVILLGVNGADMHLKGRFWPCVPCTRSP